MDSWLNRPAEYADVRRGLHLLLMSQYGMTASEAASYSPHGFRHLLITIGQQLRTLGVVTEGDIERLGHWEKNSSMVRKYDTNAGVSELSTRTALLTAVREGWRPVVNGSLPFPLPMTPGAQSLIRGCPQAPKATTYVRVGHVKRKRKHHVSTSHRVTVCGMWTCGSMSDPAAHALFANVPSAWDECRNCARSVGVLLRHGVGTDAVP